MLKKIKILLADDHPIFLDGLHSLLKNNPDLEVVAKARNGDEALQMAQLNNIDIAILDIHMPLKDGIEVAGTLFKLKPNVKVILLTMLNEARYMSNAYKKFIHGYVLKDKSTETLLDAIYAVARGNNYWPKEAMDMIRNEELKPVETPVDESDFTIREKEILCLLADDPALTNKELGERLFIAEYTVQTHLQNARKKLSFKSRGELVKYVVERGWCKDKG